MDTGNCHDGFYLCLQRIGDGEVDDLLLGLVTGLLLDGQRLAMSTFFLVYPDHFDTVLVHVHQ